MNWYKWKTAMFAYGPKNYVNKTAEVLEYCVSVHDEHGKWVHIANGLYVLETQPSAE